MEKIYNKLFKCKCGNSLYSTEPEDNYYMCNGCNKIEYDCKCNLLGEDFRYSKLT